MAAQLKLVQRKDLSTSDVGSLDLLSYTAGFEIAYEGWEPAAIKQGKVVIETMRLRARGSTHDDLASKIQTMADKAVQVGYWDDPAETNGVWLRVQLANESKARQAFIKRIEHGISIPVHSRAVTSKSHINDYALAVERAPYWEGTAYVTYAGTAINTCGGTMHYTTYGGSPGSVAGDLPSRLAFVKWSSEGTAALFPAGKVWMGFRTNQFGDRTKFVSYWSLGNPQVDDAYRTLATGATEVVDATAKGGSRVTVSFSTDATLIHRVGLGVGGVTSDPQEQRGTYLVLLRAKLSDTPGEVRVQLRSGWYNDKYTESGVVVWPNHRVYARVPIVSATGKTGEFWHFYEMGTVTIPPTRFGTNEVYLNYAELQVWAERISGTVDLYLDCLVLIPLEGMIYSGVEYNTVKITGGSSYRMIAGELPDEKKYSFASVDSGVPAAPYTPQMASTPNIIGGLPPGAGILVLAAEARAQSHISWNAAVTMLVYNRWKELRGND